MQSQMLGAPCEAAPFTQQMQGMQTLWCFVVQVYRFSSSNLLWLRCRPDSASKAICTVRFRLLTETCLLLERNTPIAIGHKISSSDNGRQLNAANIKQAEGFWRVGPRLWHGMGRHVAAGR